MHIARNSVILAVLLIAVSVLATTVVVIVVERPGGAPEWDHSLTLTFDSSLIDGDVTNFVALVNISASSGITGVDLEAVFTELGTNVLKMSLQTGAGTELWTEVERWDSANTNGQLWVKVPFVPSGADTNLTLYYDVDHADNVAYIGAVGTVTGQQVWASHHKLVWHISEGGTGTRFDSTSNDDDGFPVNYDGDEAITGQIDGADDLDAVDDVMSNAPIVVTEDMTTTFWIKTTDSDLSNIIQGGGVNGEYSILINEAGSSNINLVARDAGNNRLQAVATGTAIIDGNWNYLVFKHDLSANFMEISLNTVTQVLTFLQQETPSPYTTIRTTYWYGDYVNTRRYVDGSLDEVRKINRLLSLSEIKAEYNSQKDTFITYTVN